MANTTFNGPVRSENGFDLVKFNATTGATTTDIGLEVFEQSVTVANGATTGTSTATMPTNFIVLSAVVVVTTAATNGVYLTDVGTATDPDAYLDGMGTVIAINSAGFKGHFASNGAGGIVALGGATAAATAAPATLTLTVNSDPGSDTVFKVKLLGFSSTSDTE
jgi:hypothetical protein|tara:strand:+ start:40 stop:531 length:492 start_codon:yes stop_codon:yes gene_type:complete